MLTGVNRASVAGGGAVEKAIKRCEHLRNPASCILCYMAANPRAGEEPRRRKTKTKVTREVVKTAQREFGQLRPGLEDEILRAHDALRVAFGLSPREAARPDPVAPKLEKGWMDEMLAAPLPPEPKPRRCRCFFCRMQRMEHFGHHDTGDEEE